MKVGKWSVAIPGSPATLGPDQPIYTVQILEDCEIKGSKFFQGQIIQALAEGVFNAAGKALVYDWTLDQFVPITEALPRLPT